MEDRSSGNNQLFHGVDSLEFLRLHNVIAALSQQKNTSWEPVVVVS